MIVANISNFMKNIHGLLDERDNLAAADAIFGRDRQLHVSSRHF